MRRVARKVLPQWAKRALLHALRMRQKRIAPKTLFLPDAAESTRESPFSFMVSKTNPLEELGAKYLPTKRAHNYLAYYWLHLRDIRFDVRTVLEIGVQSDRSIRMWEEFFPNATIVGVDVDPSCRQFEGGRRRISIGDQGDRAFLQRVIQESGRAFDVIIDDGSHRVDHQLTTFEVMFPAMSEHGIYVIEDTGGCVGDPELTTVNSLKPVIDSIMYWPPGLDPEEWPRLAEFPAEATWRDRNVVGIAFYRWIVFVMRGKNPQDNPYLSRLEHR